MQHALDAVGRGAGSGRQAITSDNSEIDVTRTSFQSKNVWTNAANASSAAS